MASIKPPPPELTEKWPTIRVSSIIAAERHRSANGTRNGSTSYYVSSLSPLISFVGTIYGSIMDREQPALHSLMGVQRVMLPG